MQKEQRKQVLIIGGGASGLMAAIMAARVGAKVTVLEKQSQVGKKLLVTGNGRCNLSNINQDLTNYRCEDPAFPAAALEAFDQKETIRFFEEIGICIKNKNGYLYPYNEQAAAVADVLRMEAEALGVKMSCNTQIRRLWKEKEHFFAATPGWVYEADALILACGSSAHIEGSGDGYIYAKGFGHTIHRALPALVQLRAKKDWPAQLAGVRTDARVSLLADGKLLAEDVGEVQLLAYGISGIPVFQVSRYAARALEEKRRVEARLRFLPQLTERQIQELLETQIKRNGRRGAEAWLLGIFPRKLIPVLLKRAGIPKGQQAGEFQREQLWQLVQQVIAFSVPIQETNDFSQAQVCTGGVAVEQVKPKTMESRLVRGLYFSGELLDVDGACGGYNLQWAWTSGCLAGRAAAGWTGQRIEKGMG